MCCNVEPRIIGYKLLSNRTLVHTMRCPKCRSVWEEHIKINQTNGKTTEVEQSDEE